MEAGDPAIGIQGERGLQGVPGPPARTEKMEFSIRTLQMLFVICAVLQTSASALSGACESRVLAWRHAAEGKDVNHSKKTSTLGVPNG